MVDRKGKAVTGKGMCEKLLIQALRQKRLNQKSVSRTAQGQ